jgi:hypothetical protein
VYEDPTESLHLLFALLLEFRSNPFLQQAAGMGLAGGSEAGGRPWSEGAPRAPGSAGGWGAAAGGGPAGRGSSGGRALSRVVSSASSSSRGAAANVLAF